MSSEKKGWDDGKGFAESIRKEIQTELATMRRLNYPADYIAAWKSSVQNIFYDLTVE